MQPFNRATSLLAVVGAGVILAGCASQSGGRTSPAASNAAPGGSAMAHVVTVMHGGPGSFLAGDGGKTLYVRTTDSAGTTTCTGSCATTWPPFIVAAGETATAGTGVTGAIGTIKRPDGSIQVAINSLPLYYYSGDSAAGATNGQGIDGIWFVAAPAGGPVGAPAPAPSASGSGYHY